MITPSTGATTSEEYIIPWAIITKGDKQERVPLLRNKLGASSQEKIQFSVQNLEYAFSDALYKLFLEKQKNTANLENIEKCSLRVAGKLMWRRREQTEGKNTYSKKSSQPKVWESWVYRS